MHNPFLNLPHKQPEVVLNERDHEEVPLWWVGLGIVHITPVL